MGETRRDDDGRRCRRDWLCDLRRREEANVCRGRPGSWGFEHDEREQEEVAVTTVTAFLVLVIWNGVKKTQETGGFRSVLCPARRPVLEAQSAAKDYRTVQKMGHSPNQNLW